MLKEFKPTILFLAKFFGLYLILSVLYGMYIKSYDEQKPPQLDSITRAVTYNVVQVAELFGYKGSVVQNDHMNFTSEEEQTFDSIYLNGAYAISVEEGCNGINIMILFLAFVIGFNGRLKQMLWFIPLGFLAIHAFNLGRLLLLAYMNVELNGNGFHFFHKYFFTASIYLAVLGIWYVWVAKVSGRLAPKSAKAA